MNRHKILTPLLAIGLGFSLGACKSQSQAASGEADQAAATATQPGPAQPPSAADPAEIKAAEEAMAKLLAEANAAPPPVEGTDYVAVANPQTFDTPPGKIEVAEVFGFVCPACASFQPTVSAWKKALPADVNMVYVPAIFDGRWENYGRAFFAAQSLGLQERTHDAMYRAIHIDRSLKGELGNDSPQDIANFYQAYGADPAQFVETMNSFAVGGKINKARQFAQRTGVEGTPTLVINGKYRIIGGETRNDQIRIATQLIEKERAAAARKGG